MTALVKTESLAHCHLGCVLVFVWTLLGLAASPASAAPTLEPATFRPYIDRFNSEDHESYQQTFPNARSWDFLQDNIPLFECPDKDLELTYYFRWWTFRKHLKQTPEGWVITEFLPAVP
jgi:hypothetical protein